MMGSVIGKTNIFTIFLLLLIATIGVWQILFFQR